jgi:hypothetical protein
MKAISSIDLLEAAAYALIGQRCREFYLHDIRGGLQALQGSVELLVRAAKSPGNLPVAEKAAVLARSAMLKHEKSLVELLDQLTPRRESASSVNVGDLLGEVLRFVRNDAAGKSITLRLQNSQELAVLAEAHKFRFLLIGLCVTLTDGLAAGAMVDIKLTRSGPNALIEFCCIVPCASIPKPEDFWGSNGRLPTPPELLLTLTQAWAFANGGAVELPADSPASTAVRLYYPLGA